MSSSDDQPLDDATASTPSPASTPASDAPAEDAPAPALTGPRVVRLSPREAADPLKSALAELEALLGATGRVWMRGALLEGALWVATALCAVALSALLLALLVAPLAARGVDEVIWGGGALVLLAAGVALARFWRARPDALGVARKLYPQAPALRDDLVSALRFGASLRDESFDPQLSAPLARAHIERARERARAASQQGHLGHLLPVRELTPPALALAGCFALLLVPLLAAPQWTTRAMTGQLADVVVTQLAQLETRPLVGSISITYEEPSYTQRPPRVASFSSGHVEALVGTQVTLETYTLDGALRELSLMIEGEDGEVTPVRVTRGEGMVWSASFMLMRSGRYYFEARDAQDRVVRDPIMRAIVAQPDAPPKVQILSHEGRLEVSPDDVLELTYSVEDDFGIGALSQAHQLLGAPGEPTSRAVEGAPLEGAPRQVSGTLRLDLATLNLQPRDTVTFTLRATDQNVSTGPGVGESAPLVLVVASPEDKHLANMDAQQAILEALLISLADYLEAPLGERVLDRSGVWRQQVSGALDDATLTARIAALKGAHDQLAPKLAALAELVPRLKADPLMAPRELTLIEGMSRELTTLHERGQAALNRAPAPAILARYAAEMEAALEKTSLRLDDLLVSQKMQSAAQALDEIKAMKERLRELLERYRDTQDPALREEIMREITRLRQRMAELNQRMQDQLERMPQEHVNMDAVQDALSETDAGKVKDAFSSLEQMLERGDIDGALAALDQMSEGLDGMQEQVGEASAKVDPEGMREFDKKMAELMREADDLQVLQQDLNKDTDKLQSELQVERDAQQQALVEQAQRELLDDIEQMQRQLDDLQRDGLVPALNRPSADRVRDQLRALREGIEQGDIATARDVSRRAREELDNLRFSMQLSQRHTERRSAEHAKLSEGMRQVRPMADKADQITRRLDDLMDQARDQAQQQRRDPRAQQLAERQREARERAEALGQRLGEAEQQVPGIQGQIGEPLKRASDAMKRAGDGLERQQMQPAQDAQRQAMEALGEVKSSMKQSMQRQREGEGQRGEGSREKVEVPGPSTSSPRGWRDAVERGMKEDRLNDYASEIEDYYRSLTE